MDHLHKPCIVRPTIHLDELIEAFQENQTVIAIVKKGDTVLGMVTTEDALEELVGAINEKREAVKGGASL